MSFSAKWWKRSNASCAFSSHSSLLSAKAATSFSVSIANCSSRRVWALRWTKFKMKMMKFNGIISDKRLTINLCLPTEMEEELLVVVVKWLTMDRLLASMYAAPIAKLVETFSKKLTRFLRTVLISVNSHIDAGKTDNRSSSGRPSVNSKDTLSSIAPSLDVTSVIDPSSSTWQERNFMTTYKETALKFWLCAKSATRSIREVSSTITSASRTSTWKSWRL